MSDFIKDWSDVINGLPMHVRTEMSENEIKPVAWVDLDVWISTNDAGDSFFTDYQDDDTVAVYDQSAIDRLTADAASLRERMIELERQRDDYLSREWQAEKAKRKAEAERDAAVAAMDRIVSLKMSMFKDPYDMIGECVNIAADAIDSVEKGK